VSFCVVSAIPARANRGSEPLNRTSDTLTPSPEERVEHDLRLRVCRLVAGLIVADDDLDDAEDAFIDKMLAKFEIPPSERASIFPIVDRSEAAAEMKTLPAAVQEEAFGWLIDAAAADGKVVQEERDYLAEVGAALGISEVGIRQRLEKALKK
jgi:uncharacterized tellurite resistance protein B-like protein